MLFLPSSAQAKLIQAGLRLALFLVLASQPGKVSYEQAKGPSSIKFWKMGLLNYHNQTSPLASHQPVSQNCRG